MLKEEETGIRNQESGIRNLGSGFRAGQVDGISLQATIQ
jgi:hypothetical protein